MWFAAVACPSYVERDAGLRAICKRFQNGSMNITLKNVPDKVHRALKQEAKKQGRSLNAQIIQTLENEAAELERRKKRRVWREEVDKFVASLPPMDDSTRLIRQERDRH